jgi:hypothetical protein
MDIDIEEITDRITALTHIEVCERCEPVVTATVFDAAHAVMGIGRMYLRLLTERRRAANWEAAIRATLAAVDEGESDPIAYLRYEWADQHQNHPHTSSSEGEGSW